MGAEDGDERIMATTVCGCGLIAASRAGTNDVCAPEGSRGHDVDATARKKSQIMNSNSVILRITQSVAASSLGVG